LKTIFKFTNTVQSIFVLYPNGLFYTTDILKSIKDTIVSIKNKRGRKRSVQIGKNEFGNKYISAIGKRTQTQKGTKTQLAKYWKAKRAVPYKTKRRGYPSLINYKNFRDEIPNYSKNFRSTIYNIEYTIDMKSIAGGK